MGARQQRVEQAYGAFARGDIPAIIGMLADDVSWTVPATLPQGGSFTGRDGVTKFFEGVGAAWSALTLVPEAIGEVGDDLVVSILRAEGTLRTNGSRTAGVVHVFRFGDDVTIRSFREFTDLDAPLS